MDKELKKILDDFKNNNKVMLNHYTDDQIFLLFSNNQIFYENTNDIDELIEEFICDNEFTLLKFTDDEDLDQPVTHISYSFINFDFNSKNKFIEEFVTKLKIENFLDEDINNIITMNIYLGSNLSDGKIKDLIELLSTNFKNKFLDYKVSFAIHNANDIIKTYNNIKQKENCVKEHIFKIDMSNNILNSPLCENIKSIIVNISAKSINKIYKEKGVDNGPLYYSNLRFYVKNKKIDEDLKNSIEKDKNLFWFKNNGIVIICDKYEILPNNEIKITNFSFINGGQTTFIIGNIGSSSDLLDNKLDFYVLAKIISVENIKDELDKKNFMNSISIATNKQKPIKDVDLIANSPEIKEIQKNMSNFEPTLYLKIKRGSIPPQDIKKPIDKKIRIFQLSDLGTLISSFCLQMPGTAKNQKKIIWNDHKKFVFQYSKPNFLYISNYLSYEITLLKKELSKRISNKEILAIYKTGTYFIIAIIFFLLSYRFFSEDINSSFNKEFASKTKIFSKDNILDFLNITDIKFNNLNMNTQSLAFKKNIDDLIERVVYEINDTFVNSDYFKQDASVTFANYCKSDDNYYEVIRHLKRKIDAIEKERQTIFAILDNVFIL